MLSFFRIARFASSHHDKVAHSVAHGSHVESHSAHHEGHVHSDHCDHGDHGHHGDHGDHGHVAKAHKKIPEGSWHRHSDDEDYFYYYDRYGPFHSFSVAYYNMPDHPGGTPEDDIYRHQKQGYIRLVDPDDNRRNVYRGFLESMAAGMVLFLGVGIVMARNQMNDDFIELKVGDALTTAQEIEIFIKEAKERLR